jgi:putative PEP-CTERM system TPR-repeat lipoprotein
MTKTQITLPIALMLAVTFTLPGCHRDANLTEQERIQRAKDFEDKGNLKGSIIELKNAIEKNPNSPQARLLLGQIYLKAGMGAEAEKELTKAEKLGVNHETIQIQLGEALLLMGENKRVLDEIQAGSQTSKINLARIQQIRADALLNRGKLNDACSLYQQSMDTDRNNPPTYWGLAKCAVAKKDTTKAKELLDAALKIDDKQSLTWVMVGDLERFKNNAQGALAAYTNALKLDPNNLSALEQRITINLSVGQVEPARKDLDHLMGLAPKSVAASYLQALFNFRQAKYSEARDALQGVFKITDNHAPSILLAGATAYALGSYQQAESYLNRFLGSYPGNVYARKVLAEVQIKQNNPDRALETLLPLLSSDTKDAQVLALAGEVYLRNKDYNKAMGYLDRASELDPKNATVKTSLAAGHLAEGESDKALAELEQAASLSEKAGQADLALVVLHLKDKEYDKALQAIANLEKKLPNNPVTQNLRAVALLGKQDRTGARKALEQALVIQPNFFPAAVNLARIDVADNKPDAARKRFEAILDKDKNNIQAMMALADLAAFEKKESDYVSWLEKAVKADPKAIKPRAALTRYYLAKKENQKALTLANEAVNNNPGSLDALNLLGATQMATGDKAASITTFTRMTQKAPQSPGNLLKLALAQIANKQIGKARVNLQQAIHLKPDFLQAQDTLMQLELEDNKPDAALQIARQIQIQQPKSPIGFDREADILLVQKKFTQAIKAHEQALARGAGSSGLIKLYRALSLGGDTKAADQRLNAWIKQHPKDTAVRTFAAELYVLTNRNQDAITQYEELQKVSPNDVSILNNLANLYQREKDSRALAMAEQASKLAPNQPSVQDTLGWILVENGQVSRGLDLLRKAISNVPKGTSIRYHYAVALARSGDKLGAKKELANIINSGQKFPEIDEAKALLKSYDH